ncbi:hypothetical protein NKJ95_32675 [Mesorhizobium sp. M0012]|uniref:hypothetical protein n=1 Tax=Mesorhizobium sp. M0012 TaxID=2956840 RepID=UPI00333D8335
MICNVETEERREHVNANYRDEWIRLPNRCRLAAKIWLADSVGRSPAILEYSPYRKRDATVEPRRFEGAWIAQEYIDGHYDNANPVVIDNSHIAVPQGAGIGVKPETGIFGQPVAVYGS